MKKHKHQASIHSEDPNGHFWKEKTTAIDTHTHTLTFSPPPPTQPEIFLLFK